MRDLRRLLHDRTRRLWLRGRGLRGSGLRLRLRRMLLRAERLADLGQARGVGCDQAVGDLVARARAAAIARGNPLALRLFQKIERMGVVAQRILCAGIGAGERIVLCAQGRRGADRRLDRRRGLGTVEGLGEGGARAQEQQSRQAAGDTRARAHVRLVDHKSPTAARVGVASRSASVPRRHRGPARKLTQQRWRLCDVSHATRERDVQDRERFNGRYCGCYCGRWPGRAGTFYPRAPAPARRKRRRGECRPTT